MSVWVHVLHWWEAETPKSHPSAEQSEALNAFILWYVNEESRLPCCILETDIRLKVCSLGGRNKEEYIELKKMSSHVERRIKKSESHFSYVALLWWRSIFMCTVWRSADTFLQISFVQHCHSKPQSTADPPQKRNCDNGMLCQIRCKLFSLALCMHVCSCWIKYLLSSYVKHFHSEC